jgi:hypothetical protein
VDPLALARVLHLLGEHERAAAQALAPDPGLGSRWAQVPGNEGAEWWLQPGPVIYCGDAAAVRDLAQRHVVHHVPALANMQIHGAMGPVFALAAVLEARGLVKRAIMLGADPVTQGIAPWSQRTGLR